ncbi:MAG: hypothetical protein AMJ55_10610 [Gammaproteobacteria bacterium SG8_15]|nr:MAG: hypothetical protein AMJ55_10610 [Gammaproteobacteria bacterium SG8_15]
MQNWVFDLGAVLLEWNPHAIVSTFTADVDQQKILIREIFLHPDWLAMDCGRLAEVEAIPRAAGRTNLKHQDISALFDIVRESLTVIPASVAILENAKAKGRLLYCLSNMSTENYAYLRNKYSFFDYFHGAVISGQENTMKPEKKIFQILLERFALNPEETLFIDDRPENTRVAKEFGMSAITFSDNSECYAKISNYLSS